MSVISLTVARALVVGAFVMGALGIVVSVSLLVVRMVEVATFVVVITVVGGTFVVLICVVYTIVGGTFVVGSKTNVVNKTVCTNP